MIGWNGVAKVRLFISLPNYYLLFPTTPAQGRARWVSFYYYLTREKVSSSLLHFYFIFASLKLHVLDLRSVRSLVLVSRNCVSVPFTRE